MNYKYMVFSSVTFSLRAMSELQKAGISSRLEKIKNIPSLGGCGYALAVNENFFDTALSVVTSCGISVIEVMTSNERNS